MQLPLADNPQHLKALCHGLALGEPACKPSRVFGGLHHRVWRLETDRGSYAIKQLSPDTDLGNPDAARHFNDSETIAEAFAAKGVPAVFALSNQAGYLQLLDADGYLVHPWRDARALSPRDVSAPHAIAVAGILARMHAIDLDIPGLARHEFDVHSQDNIRLLVDLAREFDIDLADTLSRAQPSFLEIADAQPRAIEILNRQLVTSHGDLDQKNVLWDDSGEPAVIDWETAHRLNPTHEVLLQALNWSGIGSRFDPGLFARFVAAYREAGGAIETQATVAAYQCVLGDWVNWLMYNVGRCMDLEDREQRATGAKQLAFALGALQRIMDQVPELLSITDPLAPAGRSRVTANV
jgi:aminoglycoside phosphotransferase (APT) family kinase protein